MINLDLNPMFQKLNQDEYRKLINRKQPRDNNPRQTYTSSENDTSKEALQLLLQTVHQLQASGIDLLHYGDIGLDIEIQAKRRGDIDNIFKSIADALQGFAFKNDSQIAQGSIRFCKS